MALRSLLTAACTARHCCRLYSSTSIIREVLPSRITHGTETEPLVKEPEPTLTEVEESQEEWKHVERLLPRMTVPEPPNHKSYPTPSGWIPQYASPSDLPYFVRRTRFHNIPVYLQVLSGGNRPMTVIKSVEGDIWVLDEEIRQFLQDKHGKKMYTQVDEVCRKLRVRGSFCDDVADFLLKKGL